MPQAPASILETFANPNPDRDYTVEVKIPEFTCLCPLTGQPDFAQINIEYIPEKLCVELKSLKNYFWSFRNHGAFHEAVSNQILDDLCSVINPRYMRLHAQFNVRGGIYTAVVIEHQAPDWKPKEPTRS